ncbi:hypothetical protein ACLB2K_057757 [Fragaria x ananassa]
MSALTSLHVLDLRENQLDSELPVMPKGLVTVLLSKNSFSGKIPVQFGDLSQHQHLDISFNYLSGAAPSNLFSFPKISYLNLASNVLSGAFPNGLNCGGKLGFVDISNNKLAGDLPSCLGYISQAAKLETHGAPACRSFSLEELKEATKDFDFSMCLGEGSMGKIYKGKLENGTSVAIRSLAISKKCSTQNLKVQLDSLSKLHHPHLVVLLGHCIDCSGQDDSGGNRLFLVYEYISSGNYRTYLSENYPEKVLKWSDRLAILIGVAKAVHFLHTGAKGEGPKSCRKKDLEGDVYNFGFILLESLVGPIVSGKGETFLLSEMNILMLMPGVNRVLNQQQASFGSQDGRRRIVDPIVLTTCSQESLSIVVSITNKCISPEVSTRPSFEDVLWNLQYAAQVQATADADQKSDATI